MRLLVLFAVCSCGTKDVPPPPPSHALPPRAAPSRGLAVRGSIVTGEHHACGLEDTGKVMCWGKGGAGRLGTPDEADHPAPVEVPALVDVAGLASSDDITCAWTTHGLVMCWGGEDETTRPSDHRPRRVPHLDDIVQVVTGLFGACGLHANGRIACWTPEHWRDPLWPRVEDLEGVTDAIEIAGDGQQMCARLSTGHVTCKFAPDANHEDRFTTLPELDGATSLSGADEQFAALLPGRRLAFWNIGDLEGRHGGHPAKVHHFDGIDAQRVVVGHRHVCIMTADATTCWKQNDLDTASPDPRGPTESFEGGMADLVPGFDISCARRGTHAECWPPKERTPATVPGLVLGDVRPVTPTPPPPERVATAQGAPTVLAPRRMHGPWRDGVAACRAQGCPDGSKENFCEDRVAQYSSGPFMRAPPAPFKEVRLISTDCRNPDNPQDDYQRVRMMVTRADGVWLSAPLVVLGAPGKNCGAFIESRWQTRDIAGKPTVVLSLVEGASCKNPRAPDEHVMLVMVGDGQIPVTYPPVIADAHVSTFVRDGVVVDGVGTYQLAAP